jgi:hypothetical protein
MYLMVLPAFYTSDHPMHLIVLSIPGNWGLHGNSCSEQNHSSKLCYLNDGNEHGNSYCEQLIFLIKDLLQHQHRDMSMGGYQNWYKT